MATDFSFFFSFHRFFFQPVLLGLRSTLGLPAGPVVLNGFLFWYSNNNLLRVPADSAENAFVERFRLEGYDRIVDIAAVSQGSRAAVRPPCRCDFFCVPDRAAPRSYRCGCPAGQKLSGSRKCVKLRTCPDHHVLCRNALNCIPKSWICDGNEDCEVRHDFSDISNLKMKLSKMI